jgi:general nucleoside transport system ATP-binding protein
MNAPDTRVPLLAMKGISRRFGTTQALAGVDVEIHAGTVHALLGENGAGKTTLMRIANGQVAPQAGAMTLDGTSYQPSSPADAIRAGIAMVHQHLSVVEGLTVAENVALGGEGVFEPDAWEDAIRKTALEAGLEVDAEADVESLSMSARQRVEVVKALARDARLVILDEPTSVLSPVESRVLLGWMRRFAQSGGAVVLITHRLQDALDVADTISVLRNGTSVLSAPAAELDAPKLARAMLGSDPPRDAPPQVRTDTRAAVVVQASGLTIMDRGVVVLSDASFAIRAGEIVAIASVEGTALACLMRVLAAREPPDGGTLTLPPSVSFVPEDRHAEGLILDMSVAENVALRSATQRRGLFRSRKVTARTIRLLDAWSLRAAGPRAPVSTLSGGNQQKLVLARELDPLPDLLVAENPMRGLDVRAARDVANRIRRAAAAGAAVIVSSPDLDELVAIAQRAMAFRAPVLVETPVDVAAIGRAMVGA